MNKVIVFTMFVAFIAGCREEKEVKPNPCGWTVPLDAVPWIATLKKSMTDCTCEPAIIQGTYESKTVIFIALTETATCDYIWTPTLYNCEGGEVRTFTSSEKDQSELYSMVTRDVILYRCKE